MSLADWQNDITLAQQAHIDGFAMNIASQDGNTDNVLRTAFSAAEGKSFKLFLSFDYLSTGSWGKEAVIQKINQYSSSPAYFKQNGKPLVNTFEGTQNTGDWADIKANTGAYFVPDWSSLGPSGIQSHLDVIDGALNWGAWPNGASDMSTDLDTAYLNVLGSKAYMMPVSPWFYTNLPNWNKNWVWRGDDLWHERWEQVIEKNPAMVMILTWNDYGESHYIGPIYESGIPQGAGAYVINMPHEGWLTLLPHYIDAYKNGTGGSTTKSSFSSNDSSNDKITYWYRRNPGTSGFNGGTTGNTASQGQMTLPPQEVLEDKVFLTVLISQPSTISVQIGDNQATGLYADTPGISHFNVPFNGQTGRVNISIQRNGQNVATTTGPEITPATGNVNWNAYVGSSDS